MSNLLFGQWKSYYQMPCLPEVLEATLSLAAHRYYAFLCRRLNEHSAPVLEFSNHEIAQFTTIRDHKTLSKARAALVTAGLISVRRVPPGIYRHTLLNGNGEPLPPPKDRKGIRRYEARVPQVQPRDTRDQPMKPIVILAAQPYKNQARCYTHGISEHWNRDGQQVCARCHPDPRPSQAPTAQEIGFD